jgi:hypothetical protein
MLRNYCITLLTLKNEIVARLQQPFVGPSIVVEREQQHALEQVVMQVCTRIYYYYIIINYYLLLPSSPFSVPHITPSPRRAK